MKTQLPHFALTAITLTAACRARPHFTDPSILGLAGLWRSNAYGYILASQDAQLTEGDESIAGWIRQNKSLNLPGALFTPQSAYHLILRCAYLIKAMVTTLIHNPFKGSMYLLMDNWSQKLK